MKLGRRKPDPADSLSPTNDSLFGRTVLGVPFEARRTGPRDGLSLEGTTALDLKQTLFKVRLTNDGVTSSTAGRIVSKMYAWRGYKIAWHAKQQPNRITLVGSHGEVAMSTISIGFDSPEGLMVDGLYKDEVDILRKRNLAICEFTKLAIDGGLRSKRVLATIFQIAYVYAHRVCGYTDLLIEVNPRHVDFYKKTLGFEQRGPERINPGVNAPAVLLRLDLNYAERQIEKLAGRVDLVRTEKQLYVHFLPASEERGIVERLNELR